MGPFNIQIFTPLVTTHTPFFFPSIYSKASKRVVSFCYPQILFFHSFWNQLRLSLHPHHFTVAIFVKVTIDSILLNLSLISVFSLVIWRLIRIWHSHSFILEILSSLGFQDASPLFTLLPVLSQFPLLPFTTLSVRVFQGMMEIFCISIMIIQVYTFVRIHQTATLKTDELYCM